MVDPDMQGRVFSAQQLIMNTIMPVGMLVFGPVADKITIEVLLVVTSALMAIPGTWIFFNRQPVKTHSVLSKAEYELLTGD
jgi:DHA3 family macrolide efflux protein-like MFS transporter